jgi:hypothetical protein
MSNERIIGLKKEESGNQNKVLYDELFVKDSGYRLVSSTPKVFSAIHPDDFGENFYISEEELDFYIEGFIQAVSDNVGDVIDNLVKEDSAKLDDIESGLDDLDIKLSLYRSFKSLYDKWISNSISPNGVTNGYFYNNYGGDDDRMLYEHFKFVNRANQNIGDKAVIDFSYLSNLANTQNGQGPTQSLYESLTGLLSENKFDFWPLPANISLTQDSLSNEDVKDIFRTLTLVTDLKPGPTFVCVYIGGSSRTLADLQSSGDACVNNNGSFYYTDDSFDITKVEDWPAEYAASNEGVVVFKVRYGQEAQNHFDSIELDQTEFKETQESLQIIDALTNPNSGSNPSKTGKGNNMYDVYLTRSYNCTVSGLGNMSIQPLMHFKLENVPMFRGTYLITGVKHTITPHNIKTEFTGMRQPKITIPVVTEALSLIDLALAETITQGTVQNDSSSDVSNFSSSDIENFSGVDTNSKGCEIARKLSNDLSISLEQASGIVGNLVAESGLIPNRIQGGGNKTGLISESGSGGYGWAQWTTKNLKDKFKEYANTKNVNLDNTPANDEINYGYLIEWLTKIEGNLFNGFKSNTKVYDAAKYVAEKWERCADCKKETEWKKRGGYAQQVYDFCKNGTGKSNSGNLAPKGQSCDKNAVKFGLNGGGNLSGALNVIVGSSSVGTLNGISKSSTYGSLSSNNIYVYYNCPGKTLSWLASQVKADTNTYKEVKSYFQVGIGTNDGYPVNSDTKNKIKNYTNTLKSKFPNATLYVLPGTYGWGSVSNGYTKQKLKDYYKQYTDNGWTLLWPSKNSSELDPNFDTSTKAHNASSEWFKYQMKLLKDYSV